MIDYLILGAGISGLSAGYHLKKRGLNSLLIEKESEFGGLCGSFKIDGFTFDHFIHLSFTENEYVKSIFNKQVDSIEHIPNPHCYYKGKWIKHPAQNNLSPLDIEDKINFFTDYLNRKQKEEKNYADWLLNCYGKSFSECFPFKYTRKYWGVEAEELGLEWVGNRMYQPTMEEVLYGMLTDETPITYYAKKMYYPSEGGYMSYLKSLADELDINLNEKVVSIDLENQVVITTKNQYEYRHLISSLPLPSLVNVTKNIPENIQQAAKNLKYTSGYIVSIGLKKNDIPPYLWMYIYDEEILAARIYSPSLKSPNNVPVGCSSIQAEIYFDSNQQYDLTQEEVLSKTIDDLIKMKIIKKENILFTDIRFEEFANVTFDHYVYNNRNLIKTYFKSKSIQLIGRFGEWEYFWSDQSFLSGVDN